MFKSQWNIDINRIMGRFKEDVRTKAERVTQQLYDKVVEFSPVYTGRFRASWNISEGAAEYLNVDQGGEKGNPLAAVSRKAKATSPFPIFFITNGRPYGQVLEHGGPRNAPHGMVRRAIASIR
jgi:hypothetical protein